MLEKKVDTTFESDKQVSSFYFYEKVGTEAPPLREYVRAKNLSVNHFFTLPSGGIVAYTAKPVDVLKNDSCYRVVKLTDEFKAYHADALQKSITVRAASRTPKPVKKSGANHTETRAVNTPVVVATRLPLLAPIKPWNGKRHKDHGTDTNTVTHASVEAAAPALVIKAETLEQWIQEAIQTTAEVPPAVEHTLGCDCFVYTPHMLKENAAFEAVAVEALEPEGGERMVEEKKEDEVKAEALVGSAAAPIVVEDLKKSSPPKKRPIETADDCEDLEKLLEMKDDRCGVPFGYPFINHIAIPSSILPQLANHTALPIVAFDAAGARIPHRSAFRIGIPGNPMIDYHQIPDGISEPTTLAAVPNVEPVNGDTLVFATREYGLPERIMEPPTIASVANVEPVNGDTLVSTNAISGGVPDRNFGPSTEAAVADV
ncbi:hypothetical protein HK097_011507 [Rhizophlyctis rosea]|uniref:Uncharacterized protein n=1 Tax=Rhizophlyctis rosea TaxID=64517 RepID=A0AAD5WZ70_9FUNG|nr:hypothetical protein HK097_011507 [Rhizophlyctis rosea]